MAFWTSVQSVFDKYAYAFLCLPSPEIGGRAILGGSKSFTSIEQIESKTRKYPVCVVHAFSKTQALFPHIPFKAHPFLNWPEQFCIEPTSFQSFDLEAITSSNSNTQIPNLQMPEWYLNTIQAIQSNIAQGDFYEMNYCVEWEINKAIDNPISHFKQMYEHANVPYSCLIKHQDHWLLCVSPEQFIAISGDSLSSSPIKGTRPTHSNPIENQRLATELHNSLKDRAENVMIVDLMRNDLTKIAKPGSVHVPRLFEVQSFAHVHQLVSTVSCTLKEPKPSLEAIHSALFPMGSMTGAPKEAVIQAISQYEPHDRALFSGSIGILEPNSDYSSNVVIRSIQYNSSVKKASIWAGGAITLQSEAESEWQECIAKVGRLLF